ncbi:penicillin acylase family protein [Stenotrophomonas mori]|uniref:Penicillin acylase family protein n=1 Tax=Stenotrophomonas mori TaxID=2871096 RepID=A0ABT0SG36_9GAMM|nr:penicillin acylase family protein [Stenotrophomonas mori]MCL7714280.1 penicillin acylase family protein [Stenotrophomonas mori]
MLRWLLRLLVLLVGMAFIALLGAWLLLRGSLPPLDGGHPLAGLGAPAQVQRDRNGTVTVEAADARDMARALGYVHAQERFFEMDLMRRSAAGELAELFGADALPLDRRMRVHRLRARVRADLDAALGGKRALLEAYRDGVNAGVAALPVRPWPYLLLRQAPRPWSVDDSVLVGLAMYADLQDPGNTRELALARIRDVVPPALYALITHGGSSWDAPLFGAATGDAPLPDAATLDLRAMTAPSAAARTGAAPPAPTGGAGDPSIPADVAPGSNNFAVAGALTADGRAILADDMHLGLRAPNLWFRVRLRYADPAAGPVDVAGFSLPGLPLVVVGSNTRVAWGFTNSYIDTADFVRLPAEQAPALRSHQETLVVAGAADETLLVRESDWGPVLHEESGGSLLALRWTAQLPGAVRLDFADMAQARDIDDALAVADRSGIPAQNLLLADHTGRIAWQLIGTRPDRGRACTDRTVDAPAPPAACAPWGLRTDRAPLLRDPPAHRLWTANARVLTGPELAEAGDGGYDLGARARQIRDSLFARDRFDERDLLAIQLDDRALLMQRWWTLLRDTVESSDDPALQRLAAASRHWDGHAATDSTSYRIARGFRGIVLDTLEEGLLAPARQALGDAFIAPRLPQLEGIVWPMLEQRPAHLLPPSFASWDALLAHSARELERDLAAQGPDLSARTWGERNTAAVCHPLSRALPRLSRRWLCMPAQALPGDGNLPRVQTPSFGASQRMVVAPGHEADGIVHMPGGQSGHPLSPFWAAGHDDWVHGRPTPFLPGDAVHVLTLHPQ